MRQAAQRDGRPQCRTDKGPKRDTGERTAMRVDRRGAGWKACRRACIRRAGFSPSVRIFATPAMENQRRCCCCCNRCVRFFLEVVTSRCQNNFFKLLQVARRVLRPGLALIKCSTYFGMKTEAAAAVLFFFTLHFSSSSPPSYLPAPASLLIPICTWGACSFSFSLLHPPIFASLVIIILRVRKVSQAPRFLPHLSPPQPASCFPLPGVHLSFFSCPFIQMSFLFIELLFTLFLYLHVLFLLLLIFLRLLLLLFFLLLFLFLKKCINLFCPLYTETECPCGADISTSSEPKSVTGWIVKANPSSAAAFQ